MSVVPLFLVTAAAAAGLPAVGGDRHRIVLLARAGRLRSPAGRVRAARTAHEARAIPIDAARIPAIAAGGALTAVAAGPLVGAATAAVLAVVMSTVRSAVSRRRRRSTDTALLAALRLLVAELDAGARPVAAIEAAADAAPHAASLLREIATAVASGADPASAVAGTAVASVGRAWAVASRSGAPVADVLNRVADDLATGLDLGRRLDAELAGARASCVLVAVLPVFGVALGAAMGAAPLSVLTGTSWGRVVASVGLLLDAAGLWWSERITSRVLRT
ncbi:MAG: tight adherence protein [Pseudonocardiales bacterium]|nr:tight adherence protein [Pseudonocardiales bacterium]